MIKKLFEEYKFARRFSLFWCLGMITFVIMKVVTPEILINISAGGATVVTSIIAILSTVIGFYQWHRSEDDKNPDSE